MLMRGRRRRHTDEEDHNHQSIAHIYRLRVDARPIAHLCIYAVDSRAASAFGLRAVSVA